MTVITSPVVSQGFHITTLERRTDWTSELFSLRVSGTSLPFKAGQFTKLGLIDEQGELVSRAYSIVNAPTLTGDWLEFLIVTNENGRLTPKLHQLTEGELVYVANKSYGHLTADAIPSHTQDLWLLASGTGIGPFLSLLDEHNGKPDCPHIVLVHSVRHEKDLVYRFLIEQLQNEFEGRLLYVPIVTRDANVGALNQRIPYLIESGELSRLLNISFTPEHSFVMLCGNPEMIVDTNKALLALGLTKYGRRNGGNIIFERYW